MLNNLSTRSLIDRWGTNNPDISRCYKKYDSKTGHTDSPEKKELMMALRTYAPEQFQDCIERIWIAENGNQEVNIVIPPDQFVNLLFPIGKGGFFHNGNYYKTARLEGIMLNPVYLKIPPNAKLMGIRMYGCGYYPFGQTDGREILNKNIPFIVKNKYRHLIEQIYQSNNDKTAINAIYRLLQGMYDHKRYLKTTLLKDFYLDMGSNQASQNIEMFCQQAGTNYTTLSRACSKIAGITTKKFERLIRFRMALGQLLNTPEKLSSIGVGSGYFDQSHFIKEFKAYMGVPPSEYLNLLKVEDKYRMIASINFSVI